MRALLINPKAAIEAQDQGRPAKEVKNAFVQEIEVMGGLSSYYEALSTEERSVDTIDFVDLLLEEGHHTMIIDDEGLMGDPKHFIIGGCAELRSLNIPGRALIMGPADEDGKITGATMCVSQAADMLHFADDQTVGLLARMRRAS